MKRGTIQRWVGRLVLLWVLLAMSGVDAVAAIARTSGLIARGTPWETPYYVIDSGTSGPSVLVSGGIHGNEPAGALAAEQIRHWPIVCGKLTVIPRCNVGGLKADTRGVPGAPEGAGDLNRNFPPIGEARAPRGELATAIWRFVGELKPGYAIDMHEGYGTRGTGSKSVGSSVIRSPHADGVRLQRAMLDAVNAEVEDAGKRFVGLKGGADGSLERALFEHLGVCSFICETTSSGQDLARRARQHRLMAHAMLSALGMVGDTRAVLLSRETEAERRMTAVAVYDGPSAGGSATWQRLLAGMIVVPVDPLDMRDGALGPFDVVLFPGGSGSGQAKALGDVGRKAVREFVEGGGGYLGVCAGAYLATSHYSWSLGVVRAASLDTRHWRRGNGTVTVELTPAGQALFARPGVTTMPLEFRQGPILGPDPKGGGAVYEVLAWFRTGVGRNGADPQTMVDTPAIVRGACGRGRAIVFSPHPEKTQGAEDFIVSGVRWCAGR